LTGVKINNIVSLCLCPLEQARNLIEQIPTQASHIQVPKIEIRLN
jgi:hypothetical protein